jgi:uncharacterized phage-like protein YoqJ
MMVTGHRPNKLKNEYDLKGPLSRWLKNQIVAVLENEKPSKVISGVALGIDQLFALICLEMNIPVIAAIPCDNQDKIWPQQSKELYHSILNNPLVESHVICPGPYAPWKMQKRNEWTSDNTDKAIGVWDGTKGGTSSCITYLQKIGKPVIRINPNDYRAETQTSVRLQ